MKLNYLTIALLIAILSISCNKEDDNIDTQKPEIDLNIDGCFPKNGSVLYFGEQFTAKFLLIDNVELGSYSINIHGNFDGHSHSTEEDEEDEHHHDSTDANEIEEFNFSQDYSIPQGKTQYIAEPTITIPTVNNHNEKYTEGNYHFMITVTDKVGFSVFKSFEIKILHQ